MARLRFKTYTNKVIEIRDYQWVTMQNLGSANITLYDEEGGTNIIKPEASDGTGTPDNDTYSYIKIDASGTTVQLKHDGGIITVL